MKYSKKIFGSLATTLTATLAISMAAGLTMSACSDSNTDNGSSVSANDSDDTSTGKKELMTIKAYLPGNANKSLKKVSLDGITTVATTYEDAGTEIVVKWEEGDQFSVTNGTDTKTFTASGIDTTGEAATFTGEAIDCSNGCTAVYPVGADTNSVANVQVTDTMNLSSPTVDKFKFLKQYAHMSGSVSGTTDDYTVHFEQKVALVDITLPIDQGDSSKSNKSYGRITQVGMINGNDEYYVTLADYKPKDGMFSQEVKFDYRGVQKGGTIKALVAVPTTSISQADCIKLFLKYKDGSKLFYSKPVTKKVDILAGKHYTLSFASSDLDEIDDNGTWFKNMGDSCGGIWAKNDFTKDDRYFITLTKNGGSWDTTWGGPVTFAFFTASNEVTKSQTTYNVKKMLQVIDENTADMQTFTGHSKWYAPSREYFTSLVTKCKDTYCSAGISFKNTDTGYWLSYRCTYLGEGYGAIYKQNNNGQWEKTEATCGVSSASKPPEVKNDASHALHLRYHINDI
ncbi:MAG: hypothetical protein HUK20_02525 [Fibrobacter sp.]|nr:hypothetical protein [Fibrobacter sp.]